jgi:hypothetical protein
MEERPKSIVACGAGGVGVGGGGGVGVATAGHSTHHSDHIHFNPTYVQFVTNRMKDIQSRRKRIKSLVIVALIKEL